MEGLASSMMVSADGERYHDAGPIKSSSVSSVKGGHGEGAEKCKGAQGTAETEKRSCRDRSAAWSKYETGRLLQAYTQISQDRGRFRKTSVSNESFWAAVSHKVHGRSWKECQRRMDTLTKSWRVIKRHLQDLGKRFTQLEEEISRLKLATVMTVGWYIQMCEIKEGPGNARVVNTETGPVGEGDQSNATCPVFAAGHLVAEQADPVPLEQDPSPDTVALQPREASNGGTSSGQDEQLHQILCPTAPVQALVPGAPVAAPPAPGSQKRRHDAYSPQPAVDAAACEPDLPCDSAPEEVPSCDPEPLLDDPFDLDALAADHDTLTAPPDLEWLTNPGDLGHTDGTLDALQLWRLPGY